MYLTKQATIIVTGLQRYEIRIKQNEIMRAHTQETASITSIFLEKQKKQGGTSGAFGTYNMYVYRMK